MEDIEKNGEATLYGGGISHFLHVKITVTLCKTRSYIYAIIADM